MKKLHNTVLPPCCAGFSWRESLEVLKSTIASNDVAQNFSSWMAGSSQFFIVFFIISASCELGFTENLFKILPRFFDEKGIDSAILRDKKMAPFEVLKKCKFIFEP